jgi:hypothetical protein
MNMFLKRLFAWSLPLLCLQSGYAITFPNSNDCSDLTNYTTCGHPNILMVSGFDSQNLTVVGTRCTASLIKTPTSSSPTYVFLTAAHCTLAWKLVAQPVSLGVTFDPTANANGNAVDVSHFVVGTNGVNMIPVINPLFNLTGGTSKDVGIYKNDYGALVFFVDVNNDPIAQRWPNLSPVLLPQDIPGGFSLDSLVGSSVVNSGVILSAAGYGVEQIKVAPGAGGNKQGGGDQSDNTFATKRVALNEALVNLRPTVMNISQNPATDNNGTCFGDSGGPNYYTHPTYKEIMIGVTSQGDSVCRSMGTNARVDFPDAQNFISCVRNATTLDAINNCGL